MKISYHILALATVFLANEASAATALFDIPEAYYTTRGFNEVHGAGMVGWVFRVQQTVTVSQIGWYDEGKDGLSRSFQVGLWQDPANNNFAPGSPVSQLLGTSGAGIVIPAGTAAALNGVFRVVDLQSPLTLQPGTYQIGGLDSASTPDPIRYFWNDELNLSNASATVGQFFFASPDNPQPTGFRPTDSNGFYLASGFELGPMLFLVPEPSSFSLSFLAAGVLASRRRR